MLFSALAFPKKLAQNDGIRYHMNELEKNIMTHKSFSNLLFIFIKILKWYP